MDYREEVVQRIEEGLTFLEYEDRQKTVGIIAHVLKDFDIQTASKELAICPDVNEKLLNRYTACLRIGGKSEKTIEQYRRTAIKLARLAGKTYTDIGVYDIRLFLAEEKQRGISNTTLENTRANLSAFFQWLLQEDHITKNPCMNIPPIKCPDKVRYPFSSVEIDALRRACRSKKERAIVEVLLSTGVRVSELTGLELQDVNFGDQSLHIRHGKGDKERTVYMDDLARTHLGEYLAECGTMSGSVFLNEYKQALNPGGVRSILKALGKRAGVDNVHPHRFRRTFATRLAARGMDVQEIRKLLGHTNMDTTMKYVYTSDEQAHASYMRFSA